MKAVMGWFGVMMLALALVACQPEDTQLPTLARLPDAAPPLLDSPVPPDDGDQTRRATLPPAWTPTPSATATATPIMTDTPTVTPSATITDTPTITPTDFPTLDPQERAITSLVEIALQATVLPPDFVVPPPSAPLLTTPLPPQTGFGATPFVPGAGVPACQYFPSGGFALVFTNNPDISAQLGCPLGNPPDIVTINAAYQTFEGGFMVWLAGEIYVVYRTGGIYQRFADTFTEGIDPEQGAQVAPDGLFAPIRGFLKVWSSHAGVRDSLGWALAPEQGTTATTQNFVNGRMLWLPLRSDILVFIGADTGLWRSIAGRF